MLVKVTELCDVTPCADRITKGKRVYIYEVEVETLEEAITEINDNFDSDNIIWANDEFDGECEDSITLSYEITEQNF